MLIGCGGPPASSSVPRSAVAERALSRRARRMQVGDGDLARVLQALRRRARTTAPTAAISSSSEATSNASRKSVSSSLPICAGRAEARRSTRRPRRGRLSPCRGTRCRARRTARRRTAIAAQRERRPRRRRHRLVRAADVGDDEHVEDHHRAGVDDHLGGGDELRAQQQEQRRERDEVADQRQHRVERVAQRTVPSAPAMAPIAARKKKTSAIARRGGYSPAARSGVRSSGSASSISFVKMRSERL